MANHTPGPWNVHGDDKTLVGASDGKMMLARTLFLHVVPKWARNLAEAQANARLIAAAPDLLEALQGLVDTIEGIQLQYVEGNKGEGFDIEWEIGPFKMIKAREALARTWEL